MDSMFLQQQIQNLYETFARYGKPDGFPLCPCCVTEEEAARLLQGCLKELTADELSAYGELVFLTVGSSEDFKYFLPRIFELSVREEFSWPNPEFVFGKLALAEWNNWPGDERTAILELLQSKFDSVLNDSDSNGSDIERWVCALGRCVPDVTRYLNQMLATGYEEKLLTCVEWNMSAFTKNKLDNGFWKDAPENAQRVLEWLHQEEVKSLMVERYGMRL